MAHDVFVSYSSKDKVVADTIVAELEKNDIRCWYAPRDIKPGDDWGEAIANAINEGKVFLIIFSSNANRSQRVLDEVNLAISVESTILPFRIEKLDPSGAMRLHLSSRHWLDAFSPSWEGHLKTLVDSVKSNLEKKEKTINIEETKNRITKTGLKIRWGLVSVLAGVVVIGVVAGALLINGTFQLAQFPSKNFTETPMTPTITATAAPTITSTNMPSVTPIVPTPTVRLDVGSTTASPIDGMTMVYVPAGEFLMGFPSWGTEINQQPQHKVYLDAFWIDQTEVTSAMFTTCVNAGGCSAGVASLNQYNLPVTNVDWYQAKNYCEWAGRRLPTEAEWEKAARGTDGRYYPFGSGWPSDYQANFNNNVGYTKSVNSYPAGASPYGALNMAGNVWELVSDWYAANYYQNSPKSNPTGPESGNFRVMRGGSYASRENTITTTFRSAADKNGWVGFRCAISE